LRLQGPRQDAGCSSEANVGVRTAATAYTFAQREGAQPPSRIVVIGVRKATEAKLLSGLDYMILPDNVQAQLQAEATLQGYNDGLSAAASVDDLGVPALSRAVVEGYEFRDEEIAEVEEAAFDDELGMAGRELLREKLGRDRERVEQVVSMLGHVAVARE
jgi:hypothetical protein